MIFLEDFNSKQKSIFSALIYSVVIVLKSHKAQDLYLRSVWLLDNQSTFNLCCNPDVSGKSCNARRSMNMWSNGGGLQISKECMVLGYDFWVWFTARAMTNIICLKNLIRLYWVTYDSKRRMAFIVYWEEFPKYDLLYASM
jgi:hypothetical protein